MGEERNLTKDGEVIPSDCEASAPPAAAIIRVIIVARPASLGTDCGAEEGVEGIRHEKGDLTSAEEGYSDMRPPSSQGRSWD